MLSLGMLRAFCAEILLNAGLRQASAELVAESLVDAEARGIVSHGVTRLRIYVERIQKGMIDEEAEPVVVRESPASLHIDAQNAIGQVGARAGIDGAVEKAKATKVAASGVFNSNHCGALSFFLRRATSQGLVAVGASNAPATMAYYGGSSRAVGTNPLGIGIPRADGAPIVLDIAASAVARGKIILAAREGETIPDGWALDPEGNPTTDARRALEGAVLPFAGPKGSGIAMMLDLLCGGLTGAAMGREIGDLYEEWSKPQQVGHMFLVLDPEGFVGRETFLSRVTALATYVHQLPPRDGHERVLLPGELEERAYARALRQGVSLLPQVEADLEALAQSLGVSAPFSAAAANAVPDGSG